MGGAGPRDGLGSNLRRDQHLCHPALLGYDAPHVGGHRRCIVGVVLRLEHGELAVRRFGAPLHPTHGGLLQAGGVRLDRRREWAVPGSVRLRLLRLHPRMAQERQLPLRSLVLPDGSFAVRSRLALVSAQLGQHVQVVCADRLEPPGRGQLMGVAAREQGLAKVSRRSLPGLLQGHSQPVLCVGHALAVALVVLQRFQDGLKVALGVRRPLDQARQAFRLDGLVRRGRDRALVRLRPIA
mmetsp:Transcript_130112/g.376430  ORF Transcript_130112/g.376430 Transcript_130112/m.376430 type:complete len:239 (-) Transcript_130112:419-1135(-)